MRLLNIARQLKRRRAEYKLRRLRAKVEQILADTSAQPSPLSSEDVFSELQAAYDPLPEYGYDRASCWRRAAHRVQHLLEFEALRETGLRMLETSCGDGMTGALLSGYGHKVDLHDLEDWRDPRARHLPMTLGDLKDPLPFESHSFDLLCSFNAFEHVSDPSAAFAEMLRLCRPGGFILLDFGPLFASPWGLHAYRTLRMPYPQYLFTEDFIQRKLSAMGLWDLGRAQTTLQPLNRWRVRDFEALWSRDDCEVIERYHHAPDPLFTDLILRFPSAFRHRGLRWDDVTVHALRVMIRKRPLG